MNRVQKLLSRQQGLSNDLSYDFALRRLSVAKEDCWRGILPSNYSSDYNPEPPIFSAKFANCEGYRHILAIANEDGKIALQDTTRRNNELEEQALTAPQCHYNAVFDLEWAPGQMKFVSASGDHTARLWEVCGSEIRSIRAFVGHTRSVKTAAFRKCDSSVFATGGRDGAIIIWDTRANLNVDLTPRADNCIYSGHVGGPGTPVSHRKRTRTPKLAPTTTSTSVTGLAFQDTNTLISCGAGDGVIKVWDLRRNYTAYKKEPHPKHSLPYAGASTFKGFTNLFIDAAGTRLYANCMDNTIYCYNLFSYDAKPLARYKGLLNSTFYIKSCLSPDGRYLLSGSSDEKAYIWNLDYADEPLVALSGHAAEVTCVAWGATHDQPLVTCSDDARHKIWRIGPEEMSESQRAEMYRGQAEYVRTFGHKPHGSTHKYNLRDLESTPRSMRRLVEQNERTPNSMEKLPTKRSFLEMLGGATAANCDGASDCGDEQELKRPKTTLESRARRLFSPSASTSAAALASCSSSSSTMPISPRCLNLQLSTIPEERVGISTPSFSATPTADNSIVTSPLSRNQQQPSLQLPFSPSPNHSNQENTPSSSANNKTLTANFTPSPLSERTVVQNLNHMYTSPPSSAAAQAAATGGQPPTSQQSLAATIYSPTSNLPNYVLDGEAPHLGIMSPKRKLKDKMDWLTKIRKQKLMSSSRGTTLSEKMHDERSSSGGAELNASVLSSPRLQSLRNSEGTSPRLAATPRRRISHSGHHQQQQQQQHAAEASASSSPSRTQHPHSQHHPKTPTSSRRNSETTILRFFSVQTQQQQQQQQQQRNEDSSYDRPRSPAASSPPSPTPVASLNNASHSQPPATTTAACTE